MDPDTLRAHLETLRWSQRELARRCQCDDGAVRRWARGAAEIPEDVAGWLATLARLIGPLVSRVAQWELKIAEIEAAHPAPKATREHHRWNPAATPPPHSPASEPTQPPAWT